MKVSTAVSEVLKDEKKDDKVSFKKVLPFIILGIIVTTTILVTLAAGFGLTEWDRWKDPLFFLVVTFVGSLGPYIFLEWIAK